jgi:3-oxoacyl-[acyl-carrier protein] reductase
MDLGLKGKRVLVTGGTRGIGRAIVETFSAEGAQVALCARNEEEISAAVSALAQSGGTAYGAIVDVSDEGALREWVESAAEQMGGLDAVVSNVGAMAVGTDRYAWEKNLNMDVMPLVNLVDAATPLLEKAAADNGDASVVAIGSTASACVNNASSYGAIKGALVHYVKGLAIDMAPKIIRANVVSPGMVYFEGGVWNRVKDNRPEAYEAALQRNPRGRMAEPQEIANAAVFLSSPRASFVSGINMIVDGAMTDRVNY